jgi:eukaryotic-like serine/threonine-protein kinase
MNRLASQARKLIEAAALGLLATAPLYLAPASIVARLDATLFDTWSRAAPAPPAPWLAVASVDAQGLAELAVTAATEGVELLVTTLPDPGEHSVLPTLGPTEVGIDASRSQATAWTQGGPLLPLADLDGVVRRDPALPRAGQLQPSLALAAARRLTPTHLQAKPLLRLAGLDTLKRWPQTEATAPTGAVRMLVAGPSGASYATPAGVVTTPELVALLVGSHAGGHYLTAVPWVTFLAWLAALALATAIGTLVSSTPQAIVATLTGVATLLAASAISFAWANLWLAVTGPIAWLTLTSALLTVRRRSANIGKGVNPGERVTLARQAASCGQLKEAWNLYRPTPASADLLPELYDLASNLQARGAQDEATELFHRIAQSDSGFRDVAHRLVSSAHRALPNADDKLEPMPSSIGRYQLLERIGRGAMGNVYLCRDPIINRIVALKAIDLSIGFDDEAMESTAESFMREATIAGSLSHPNIVTIYDVGETNGLAYIAMEYVRGRHLSEFTAAERLLPIPTVLDLVARAADALDYAHRNNIVHRDIKPANIMYDWISNNLKITDFGIAKLIDANRTRTGIVLGTPAYMSPEQLEGRNVNGHTDLFALGVSLYQLLTSQLPFRGASMTSLMFVIANEPHEPVTRLRSDLPKWLDDVVDRALAKDPGARFQSGAQMAAALRNAA